MDPMQEAVFETAFHVGSMALGFSGLRLSSWSCLASPRSIDLWLGSQARRQPRAQRGEAERSQRAGYQVSGSGAPFGSEPSTSRKP